MTEYDRGSGSSPVLWNLTRIKQTANSTTNIHIKLADIIFLVMVGYLTLILRSVCISTDHRKTTIHPISKTCGTNDHKSRIPIS